MVRQTRVKPEYRVPSMAEIEALPWNGYNVVSTFSGAGGSCLGYRMAGYRVLWANEFVPAAAETYRANHPHTILDTQDIRSVQPKAILEAIGIARGELDLLDGSPPCAAFSTAGKREKGWGQVKNYSDTKQRVDDLFFEYARILEGLQPKTFIAENVSGLVKGKAKGYFIEILTALKACGYNVKAQLLDAQWLGVPQMRQRVFFVGVRSDLGCAPVFPRPLAYRYSVRDALPWLRGFDKGGGFGDAYEVDAGKYPFDTVGVGPSSGNGLAGKVIHDTSGLFSQGDITNHPCPAITVGINSLNSAHYQVEQGKVRRNLTISELKRICSFPDDFILTGTYAQQWERMGRAVPPVMMMHLATAIRDGVLGRFTNNPA